MTKELTGVAGTSKKKKQISASSDVFSQKNVWFFLGYMYTIAKKFVKKTKLLTKFEAEEQRLSFDIKRYTVSLKKEHYVFKAEYNPVVQYMDVAADGIKPWLSFSSTLSKKTKDIAIKASSLFLISGVLGAIEDIYSCYSTSIDINSAFVGDSLSNETIIHNIEEVLFKTDFSHFVYEIDSKKLDQKTTVAKFSAYKKSALSKKIKVRLYNIFEDVVLTIAGFFGFSLLVAFMQTAFTLVAVGLYSKSADMDTKSEDTLKEKVSACEERTRKLYKKLFFRKGVKGRFKKDMILLRQLKVLCDFSQLSEDDKITFLETLNGKKNVLPILLAARSDRSVLDSIDTSQLVEAVINNLDKRNTTKKLISEELNFTAQSLIDGFLQKGLVFFLAFTIVVLIGASIAAPYVAIIIILSLIILDDLAIKPAEVFIKGLFLDIICSKTIRSLLPISLFAKDTINNHYLEKEKDPAKKAKLSLAIAADSPEVLGVLQDDNFIFSSSKKNKQTKL